MIWEYHYFWKYPCIINWSHAQTLREKLTANPRENHWTWSFPFGFGLFSEAIWLVLRTVTKTLVICCISGIILPSYMGISTRSISHYKDPRWWQLKYFLYSPLFGEDFQFDEHIFQMGWFNHQLGSLLINQDFMVHVTGVLGLIARLFRRNNRRRCDLAKRFVFSHKMGPPKKVIHSGNLT